jgi:carboxymethylenebutenolidase
MRQEIHFGSTSDGPGGVLVRSGSHDEGPAVLITTAIAGVNDYVLRQADRLAEEGYVCLVLDYYARTGGTPPDLSSLELIMKAVGDLSDPMVLDDMHTAVAWLADQPFTAGQRVGALGFCIGGTYALMAAAQIPELSCAVTFYGTLRYRELNEKKPVSPLDAASKIACPVLGHFGEADHLIPLSDVQELTEQVKGRPAEIYTYPGAGHAFHEDFRPQVYRPVAATTAWARTREYLSWYL